MYKFSAAEIMFLGDAGVYVERSGGEWHATVRHGRETVSEFQVPVDLFAPGCVMHGVLAMAKAAQTAARTVESLARPHVW